MRAYSAISLLALVAGTGCSEGAKSPTPACTYLYVGSAGAIISYLASPAPNATGVPDSTTTLVFFDPPRAIALNVAGAAANATPIATTPTALPSPFPSSLGSPDPNSYFAVSIPPLRAATTYEAGTYTDQNACAGQNYFYPLGSFTTQ